MDDLQAMTPEDVRRVWNSYLTGVSLAYVGDPRRVAQRRFNSF